MGKISAMKHVNQNFNLDLLFPFIDSSSSKGFSKEKRSCHTCLLYGRTGEGTVACRSDVNILFMHICYLVLYFDIQRFYLF